MMEYAIVWDLVDLVLFSFFMLMYNSYLMSPCRAFGLLPNFSFVLEKIFPVTDHTFACLGLMFLAYLLGTYVVVSVGPAGAPTWWRCHKTWAKMASGKQTQARMPAFFYSIFKYSRGFTAWNHVCLFSCLPIYLIIWAPVELVVWSQSFSFDF